MPGPSTTGANAALNGIAGAGHFISLHTGDPGTTGANEATGGGYARQNITWPSSAGTLVYATNIPFSLAAGTYTYWGWWSLTSGGVWIDGGLLSKPIILAVASTANITRITLSAA